MERRSSEGHRYREGVDSAVCEAVEVYHTKTGKALSLPQTAEYPGDDYDDTEVMDLIDLHPSMGKVLEGVLQYVGS